MQERLGTKPLLPSQHPERRVAALRRGSEALVSQPGPNHANENSSAIVYYQVQACCAWCGSLAGM